MKKVHWLLVVILCCGMTNVLAVSDAKDIVGITDNVTSSFQSIGALMAATAYLAGFALTIAAIFKFKQHKDNPTQIPMGTPVALLVLGIALIFLPGFIRPAGTTIFGDKVDTIAGGYTGEGAKQLPGGNI